MTVRSFPLSRSTPVSTAPSRLNSSHADSSSIFCAEQRFFSADHAELVFSGVQESLSAYYPVGIILAFGNISDVSAVKFFSHIALEFNTICIRRRFIPFQKSEHYYPLTD